MPDAIVRSSPRTSGKIISFPISKVDEAKREIWGFATTEALDQQGEIVDYEASVRAFDKWTGQFEKTTDGGSLGNVREMHTAKAVGKVIAYDPDPISRGIWVGVKVSNSTEGNDAWSKVQDRILNGFSIGAPKAERVVEFHGSRKVNRVIDYDLAELSLVDNPACPESFFHEIKLASTFADGTPAAFEMSLLKRFEGEAKPSGVDWKAAPNILQKTVELNPETFVDGSGDIWTRVGGRIEKKESAMDTVEKAGKKVGPQHKPAGVPPGPSAQAKPDEGAPPMPKAEGMGKEAPPASNPTLGGDGANDGRNAGNSEQEKQIKGEATPPPGMGKETEGEDKEHVEPDGDEAAKSVEVSAEDGKSASAAMSYCSMCGGKMKSFGDSVAPYHKRCLDSHKVKASAAGKSAASGIAGGMSEEGFTKAVTSAVASAVNPIIEKFNANFTAMEKRIADMEKSPAPGGPLRTELPPGVGVVEKGNAAEKSSTDPDAILEKAMSLVSDPAARQAISMQIALKSVRDVQNRKVMG